MRGSAGRSDERKEDPVDCLTRAVGRGWGSRAWKWRVLFMEGAWQRRRRQRPKLPPCSRGFHLQRNVGR